jgi:methionyl-tRNA formyltransferase
VLTRPLNIIFAGTPAFAAVTLDALIHSKHSIQAVYTQPDRRAGRGQKLLSSPVKERALRYDLPVYQPIHLRHPDDQQVMAAIKADVMIVVAYGLLLPKAVLQMPHFGCINVHASLLPRWRGAAPIQRAILAGDKKTGITIMQMDEGLDTGPMLYSTACPIEERDTSETLHTRLAQMGAEAVLKTLEQLETIKPVLQDNTMATYAHKISKEEAVLDWQLSADELDRTIRAFNPWPIAQTCLGEQTVRIWEAIVIEGTPSKKDCDRHFDPSLFSGTDFLPSTLHILPGCDVLQTRMDKNGGGRSPKKPGEIIQSTAEGIDVVTGKNTLRILKMQLPGGRSLPVADILNAHHEDFAAGQFFGEHRP